MKLIKSGIAPVIILSALIALQACKTKKLAQKPIAAAQPTQPATTVQQPTQPAKPVQQQITAPVEKPNYGFSNIQFEFNSSVLKTSSYPLLDKAASEMKMSPAIKFDLNGYASREGTFEHNMVLSEDRANSVKEYLINSGVSSANLITKGYGIKHPTADNDTEEGRELNRRVEIHKLN
jgi:OmpA-OmpF porin, OOP family